MVYRTVKEGKACEAPSVGKYLIVAPTTPALPLPPSESILVGGRYSVRMNRLPPFGYCFDEGSLRVVLELIWPWNRYVPTL
ncbi:hypothetical protein SESBI_24454 [Sesbania bispinosa]|nr:hypothetical protein SESBI_24454 [Sesbania bispinosa]